jgi:hypothetical protein
VASLSSSDPLFLLADANARVGSLQSIAVGPRYPDPEDPPGEVVYQFLLDYALCLPATFVSQSESGTWMSRSGKMHRIDHIAIPQCMLPMVQSAYVSTDIALSTSQYVDHLAAVLDVLIPTSLQGIIPSGTLSVPNRWSLSLPRVQQQIADLWAVAPPLPYGMEVERMDALLTRYAQNIFAKSVFSCS